MLEWLYKTPGKIAEEAYPDQQETLADLRVRRPDIVANQLGVIPLQRAVQVEPPTVMQPSDADIGISTLDL